MAHTKHKYTSHPEKAPYGGWLVVALPLGILAWFCIGYAIKWVVG